MSFSDWLRCQIWLAEVGLFAGVVIAFVRENRR